METIVIYQGDDACTQCLGWKQVASESKESWKYWAELPAPSNLAAQLGIVYPVECPRCHGSGIESKSQQ